MAQISAAVTIDDEAKPELLASLLELEVEDDRALASTFRLKVGIMRGDQGLWQFLDDETIKPWARVAISVTLAEEEQPLIDGYLTQARAHIDPNEESSYLELVGMDGSVLMGLEEKIRDWANKKDSDIAEAIFREHGLSANVEDTGVVHDEAVSTIIQRASDIHFLKRLAARNGFECVVRGGEGFFGPPALDDSPLPNLLAAHFGDQTNLVSFDARWDVCRSAAFDVVGFDTVAKEILHVTTESSPQRKLGRDRAPGAEVPEGITPRAFAKHVVTTGQPETTTLGQALFDQAEWFVEGRGEVDTAMYGAVLQAGRVVPIKGVGGPFSGLYYLTSVKHVITLDRQIQRFTARRNALFPEDGDFPDATGGLPL